MKIVKNKLERLQTLYDYIRNCFVENLYIPSYHEISKEFGISTASIHQYMHDLEDLGLIEIIDRRIILLGYKVSECFDKEWYDINNYLKK